MDFFSSSLPSLLAPKHSANPQARARKPDAGQCGWYDSSFELREGLEVIEQQDDDLYQLWQLASPR